MSAFPDLFVNNEVVLVTINYRLGLLGFLSTQDDVIPGNNGLKDELIAIQWTHNNIHLFGGNSNQITIFGGSAGSASCAYQQLSQNSEGKLFRGIILESGSFLNPWALQRNATNNAFGTAQILNFTFQSNNNSQDLIQYLQDVDAKELNTAAGQYFASQVTLPWELNLWGPVIEVKNQEAFITKKMFGLVQSGNVLTVPSLMGFNSEESLFFNPDDSKSLAVAWDQDLSLIVPKNMQIDDETHLAEMGASIRAIYTGGEPFADHLADCIKYSSDNWFTRPILKHAELLSKYAKTYFYQFSYNGVLGNIDMHYSGPASVGHSKDAAYLFCSGAGCDERLYPESDVITRNRLIKLWTDFAKYL
ncbi:unnamed protein product [Tenebrio molitor]|nr:unnamed protein product [Tenebrio molitor]